VDGWYASSVANLPPFWAKSGEFVPHGANFGTFESIMDLKTVLEYSSLERIDDGRIAIVTMRRAEKRNALSLDVMRELTRVFRSLADDADVCVTILRGEGPAFSAGHDLQELRCGDRTTAQDEARFEEIFDACVQLMEAIQEVPVPVIAEVATVATAAGCQLVATCDLAVASTHARFATPGVRIGLFCSTPMVAVSRTIARKRAMEMLLTGDFVDGPTAAQWGLVNRCVPPENLAEETLALARKIAQASRAVVRLGKRAFYEQIEMNQRDAYQAMKQVMSRNALLADAQEGIGAFIEKRAPVWQD
jgi:enoyl-CoA hydratase/carnithine racemase